MEPGACAGQVPSPPTESHQQARVILPWEPGSLPPVTADPPAQWVVFMLPLPPPGQPAGHAWWGVLPPKLKYCCAPSLFHVNCQERSLSRDPGMGCPRSRLGD